MDPTPDTGIPPQPQPSAQATPDRDIVENKDIAALGYVWALSVFVYLYKRESPFVRHHARQGIVLFILSILFWMVPVIGRFLELPVLALMIMGFLNAAQGKYSPLPLVYALSHGDIRMLRQSWKVIVDAIVRMWRKIRSHHPVSPINVTVQTTPAVSTSPNSPAPVSPIAPFSPLSDVSTPASESVASTMQSPIAASDSMLRPSSSSASSVPPTSQL